MWCGGDKRQGGVAELKKICGGASKLGGLKRNMCDEECRDTQRWALSRERHLPAPASSAVIARHCLPTLFPLS